MINTLCFIDWDVDPVMFTIPIKLFGGDGIDIRYYSLFFGLAFWLGYIITSKMFKDQKLPEDWVDKIFIYVIVATIVGARLGHVFFYGWDYYSQHPIEILQVNKGGLASHGGTLGIMLALYIFSKKVSHKSLLWAFDNIAVPVALAAFFIRMGNLMNSEIVGAPTDVPWAFRFLRLHPDQATIPRHPTQIYEALFYLGVFVLLCVLYKKYNFIRREGGLFGVFMTCVFGFRFLIENIKENQESFEDGMLLNMGQILSIPFVIIGVICLVRALKNEPQTSYDATKRNTSRQ